MARIRSIWPTQWVDGAFLRLKPIERLLVLALRNIADDNGIFLLDPVEIKAQCLPSDEVDVTRIVQVLCADDTRIVRVFSANGSEYGQLRNFAEYQSPQKPKFHYPAPEQGPNDGPEWALNSKFPNDLHYSNLLVPYADDTGTIPVQYPYCKERKGMEGSGKESTHPPNPPPGGAASESPRQKQEGFKKSAPKTHDNLETKTPEFLTFWNLYAKKKNSGQAAKTWNKINPSKATVGLIMAAAKHQGRPKRREAPVHAQPVDMAESAGLVGQTQWPSSTRGQD